MFSTRQPTVAEAVCGGPPVQCDLHCHRAEQDRLCQHHTGQRGGQVRWKVEREGRGRGRHGHVMMSPVSLHAAGLQGADGVHAGHHMVANAAPALCQVRSWCNGRGVSKAILSPPTQTGRHRHSPGQCCCSAGNMWLLWLPGGYWQCDTGQALPRNVCIRNSSFVLNLFV